MSYYEPSSLYALQEEKNYLESLGDGDSGVERDWWGLYKTCQVRRERGVTSLLRKKDTAFITTREEQWMLTTDQYQLSSIFSAGL